MNLEAEEIGTIMLEEVRKHQKYFKGKNLTFLHEAQFVTTIKGTDVSLILRTQTPEQVPVPCGNPKEGEK